MVNESGRHGLSCKFAKGLHPRHDAGNEAIKRSLASAQVAARREPRGLCRLDDKRPDGRTLYPWSKGKPLAWDFTVVDSLAASYVTATSVDAGRAAVKAEKEQGKKVFKSYCLPM